jgi:hypothetical protein
VNSVDIAIGIGIGNATVTGTEIMAEVEGRIRIVAATVPAMTILTPVGEVATETVTETVIETVIETAIETDAAPGTARETELGPRIVEGSAVGIGTTETRTIA